MKYLNLTGITTKLTVKLVERGKKKFGTLKKLSDVTGISPKTLHRYEIGKCHPQMELYIILCGVVDNQWPEGFDPDAIDFLLSLLSLSLK